MKTNLELAVNHAMSEAALIRARQSLVATPGLDGKRTSAWKEYGFPDAIDDDMLFNLYRRGGLAHGAVKKVVNKCWETNPEVIQGDEDDDARDETPWEEGVKKVLTKRVWRAFAEADRRRLGMRFSALLLHIADGAAWDQPVTGGSPLLKKVTPVWSSSLKPGDIDTDIQSQTYGEPKYWKYTESGNVTSASGAATVGRTLTVHKSRIFILGDWRAGAIGWLEPAYNCFVSIEKVEGGSGEAYLKNAARQLAVNFAKDIDFNNLAAMYGVTVDELQEKFNEVAVDINRGNDAMMVMQGADVTPLVANAPDPLAPYNVNVQSAAAALDIPSKVWVGNQTGERASTEDGKQFNKSCQQRRGDLSFEIEEFVEQLQSVKVLEVADDFAVIWQDLTESAPSDKMGSAKTMADVNKILIETGDTAFTTEEIRVAAGFEPEKPKQEGMPDADPEETPEAADPPAQ